jgi:hypothetical protein
VGKKPKIQFGSNEELIRLYAKAAHDHREALEGRDPKSGNEAADMVATIYRELKNRGRVAHSLLLPLLDEPDAGVRGWAAAHALEFAPERGEPALEALSKEPRLLGFSARTTLKIWREGNLMFP